MTGSGLGLGTRNIMHFLYTSECRNCGASLSKLEQMLFVHLLWWVEASCCRHPTFLWEPLLPSLPAGLPCLIADVPALLRESLFPSLPAGLPCFAAGIPGLLWESLFPSLPAGLPYLAVDIPALLRDSLLPS